MKTERPVEDQGYVRVVHTQFNQSNTLIFFRKLFYCLVLPLIFPLILITKASDHAFHMISELLSLIPFPFGIIIRNAFYRQTLTCCGDNVLIGFGTVFFYKNISIGNNVLIGLYCSINHCDIGDNVLISDGCRFLSGAKQHGFERADIPMTMQDGWMKKIKIGNDVWIGANSVIMEDVEDGTIVGSGAVVNKKIEQYSIYAGNPAKFLKKRI